MNSANRPGAVDDLSRLYRETIRRHAASPVGYRRKIHPTHQHEEHNPLCGDRILLQLRLSAELVEAAAFDGEACAICMASASLLCEQVRGQSIDLLRRLHDQLHEALGGEELLQDLEVLKPLLGVRLYPSRIRCATLPWTAAIKALE